MDLTTIWNILLVVIGFSAVIIVHELGHFLVAKWVGIRVERFALGFGPRLFGLKVGETDYCINLLPLGGYVKMSGQEDFSLEKEATPDPRAYNNKSIAARMAVVSAGVIMNILFAIIAFMIVFLHGVNFPANQIGDLHFGSPAYDQLSPGDRILQVAGRDTPTINDVRIGTALYGRNGEPITLRVQHLDGSQQNVTLTAEAARELENLPGIGIMPDATLDVPADFKPDELNGEAKERVAWLVNAGVQSGDSIVQINGQPVRFYSDIVRIIRATHGQPLQLTYAARRDGAEKRIAVTTQPELPSPMNESTDKLNLLGAHPRLEVVAVTDEPQGSLWWKSYLPARGVLHKGDVVLVYGDQADPSYRQFSAATNSANGKPVSVRVLRDGKPVTVELTPAYRMAEKRAILGVGLAFETSASLGKIDDGSPMAQAGLPSGAAILRVAPPGAATQPDDADAKALTWSALYSRLAADSGKSVTLVYRLNNQIHAAAINIPPVTEWERHFAVEPPPMPMQTYKVLFTANGNPLKAVAMGLDRTWSFIQQAYVTIGGLVTGKFSIGHMTGPVGIAAVSYQYSKQGFIDLLYFLALISANLAVINFLPLPVVDGGLFAFLVVEKIQRRPISLRVQHVTQVIGIVLILGIFLLVTWQDILRFFLR